jgi:uncharacterized protein involved in outer membrane biogenesis
MKKLLRIIISIVVLMIFVCIVGISALIMFINPNKLKPIIAAEIKTQTGYEAIIDGSFSWSFYPKVGVTVEHIALLVPKQPTPFIDLHNVIFVAELRQLLQGKQKLRGDIYISDVKLLNVHAQDAHVGLHWQNKTLLLQPIIAKLYDGSLEGIAHGRALSSGAPQWDWDMHLTHIQLHPFFQDINGVNAKLKISGIGQITLHGTVQGKTREQIVSSMRGSSTFTLQNGVVEGLDLNYLLRSADALINKQPIPPIATATNETAFDRLQGTANIVGGVASTSDLLLTSPAFMINGSGRINLLSQIMNLQLRMTPQKDARTQWIIPILVTGDLTHPDAQLDMTELNIILAKISLEKIKDKAIESIEKIKTKASEKVKEHFSGKTAELLQDLLGK